MWPKGDYPLIEVGEFELNRNPENFFADVEQRRSRPNLVLASAPRRIHAQARLFNYADAQRYRLGTNYHQIPVNAARCPVNSNHRDGIGRVDGNYGSLPHYEPNSFNQWQEQPQFREPPLKISGDADWWDFRQDDDNYFKQPGDLFRLMTPEKQQLLFDNTARAMGERRTSSSAPRENCTKVDPAYGAGVEAALRKLGAFASEDSHHEHVTGNMTSEWARNGPILFRHSAPTAHRPVDRRLPGLMTPFDSVHRTAPPPMSFKTRLEDPDMSLSDRNRHIALPKPGWRMTSWFIQQHQLTGSRRNGQPVRTRLMQ